ncbi:type II toxin-antitoxin system Phd/YefM family antitoxin [Rhodoluna limnophila]|uniref:type II toxin-antitoxin system Phd/YefM family antitoxin n=1 Tax=Rhodoluna limnophila TaxID=232537 RepID=UPI0015621381|nr:type II toxin-antitoxin system Phd/YefM family antitoxin [Rhodoluna limnophila]
MKFFSMAEARAKFAQILDSLTGSEEPVVITRNGDPSAVLLSIDEYESMIETLEIMSDKETYAEIMQYLDDPDGTPFFTADEIKAQLAERVAREDAAAAIRREERRAALLAEIEGQEK